MVKNTQILLLAVMLMVGYILSLVAAVNRKLFVTMDYLHIQTYKRTDQVEKILDLPALRLSCSSDSSALLFDLLHLCTLFNI